MGYDAYPDPYATRCAGYAVPGQCDMPFCTTSIRLGLDSKCVAAVPHGSRCEMFFCEQHRGHGDAAHEMATPKPDSPEWVDCLLDAPEWALWREGAAEEVAGLEARRLRKR